MHVATSMLTSALAQARADWLAGDPTAWTRYADCLAQLESHAQTKTAAAAPPPPKRMLTRAPRGLA